MPVLAVDTCWVWRIRLWNGGYGKALYAQLPDGKIAVYGHLSGFVPEIEAVVEKEQDLKGTYEVEVYFEPNVFAFLPGETLGFSGDTGSGPPHLHFELRSGRHDHRKINPFPEYMIFSESLPPRIRRIMVTPLSADCAVNGRYGTTRLRVDQVPDTLRLTGRFGVSVNADDRARCDRTLTPTRYEAWIDDVALWKLNLDRFPFSKSHFIGSIYHRGGEDTFVRLYDPYGLDLRGFTCVPDGISTLPAGLAEGYHRLRLTVADAWGNVDSLRIPLLLGKTPAFEAFEVVDDSLGIEVRVVPDCVHCVVEIAFRECGGENAGWIPLETTLSDSVYVARIEPAGQDAEVMCRLSGALGYSRSGRLATCGPPAPGSAPGAGVTVGGNHGGEAGPARDAAAGADTGVTIEAVLHSDFFEVYSRLAAVPRALPVAHIHERSRVTATVLQPVGEHTFRGTYFPETEAGVIHVRVEALIGPVEAQQTIGLVVKQIKAGSRFWLLGDRFKVRLSASPGYSSHTLVTLSDDEGGVYEGFGEAAGRIRLEPEGVFFNERLEVLVVPRDRNLSPNHGVFAERNGRPVFLARFDSTGVCVVNLRRLEPLVVLEDRNPPEIGGLGRLRARAADDKGVFTAKVVDRESGLDVASLRAFIDDDVAIAGYDPDTGRLTGRSRKPLQTGQHRIRLEARDRMGNLTAVEETVDLIR